MPFTLFALIPPQATVTAARMPFRIVLALCLLCLTACASRPVVPHADVPQAEAPIETQPLPPEIKPLTVEQEEQVAG